MANFEISPYFIVIVIIAAVGKVIFWMFVCTRCDNRSRDPTVIIERVVTEPSLPAVLNVNGGPCPPPGYYTPYPGQNERTVDLTPQVGISPVLNVNGGPCPPPGYYTPYPGQNERTVDVTPQVGISPVLNVNGGPCPPPGYYTPYPGQNERTVDVTPQVGISQKHTLVQTY